ncbi:MAG: ABC transporter ATP-binding protein [Thermoplasmata archaeon]
MSSSETRLSVESLSAAWEGDPVLEAVSFSVTAGELAVLLGPNGSGKTTLLRCLAGLEPLTAGHVRLDGQDLAQIPPHRRGIALMFQDPALFPHRTVFENIAYAPLLRRRPRAEIDTDVDRLVALLGLKGLEDRLPASLSGGERQKVALARTLAARPKVILLDEPFASIDVEVKAELRAEFRRVLRSLDTTAVHVTHDREEGFFLGDRVGLLFDGRLEAWGTPSEVYERPSGPRAARFLGYNVLSSPRGDVAVAPADLTIDPSPSAAPRYTVVASGSVGRESVVVLRGASGERAELRALEPFARPPIGAQVALRWERFRPLGPEPTPSQIAKRPPGVGPA